MLESEEDKQGVQISRPRSHESRARPENISHGMDTLSDLGAQRPPDEHGWPISSQISIDRVKEWYGAQCEGHAPRAAGILRRHVQVAEGSERPVGAGCTGAKSDQY
jgi:hypothetical protein